MNDIILNCLDTLAPKGQQCIISGENPFVSPIFSAGDVVISLFLFIIIILILIYFVRSAINSVQVVRKFQGNNSPDGKEFYEL